MTGVAYYRICPQFYKTRFVSFKFVCFICLITLLVPITVKAVVTVNYGYDELNRLVSVTRSDGPVYTYQYDSVSNITYKNLTSPDSDGDTLKDIEEITYGLDPNRRDTDGDGLDDYYEVCFDGDCSSYDPYHPFDNPDGRDLNALSADTDGDGISDDAELAAGTVPLDASSFPAIADGDLNIDGVVNSVDVLLAIQISQQKIVPDSQQFIHGDVAPLINGVPQPDGIINAGDVLLIQRKALGKITF